MGPVLPTIWPPREAMGRWLGLVSGYSRLAAQSLGVDLVASLASQSVMGTSLVVELDLAG